MTTLLCVCGGNPRDQASSAATRGRSAQPLARPAFTLVEMLVALAISLLLMAAVVSVFANVSRSVANRRSSIEMISQLRYVRGLLQADLAGATCPGIPNQRPEDGQGYIELIEGPRCDFDPSIWLIDTNNDGVPDDLDGAGGLPVFDLSSSLVPSSNLRRLPGSTAAAQTASGVEPVTDGGGLGDADDTLMLTVRNEATPFRGRIPAAVTGGSGAALPFAAWGSVEYSSPLAEVAWFAFENPVESEEFASGEFGEPGLRTIHRRVLLVVPDLEYGFTVSNVATGQPQPTGPGVVRVLGGGVQFDEVDQALASLIAFQERYDVSVRLEWRPEWQRWVLVANSLRDLTKRENRFEHFGFVGEAVPPQFPFNAASNGAGYGGAPGVSYVYDPELVSPPPNDRTSFAAIAPAGEVLAYRPNSEILPEEGSGFPRPFVSLPPPPGLQFATARAITNRRGAVIGMTNGLAPLGGARRGQDVVMTDVLGFDLQVLDALAPVVASINAADTDQPTDFPGVVFAPGDRGWGEAVRTGGWEADGDEFGGTATVASRGAYVDLGYVTLHDSFMRRNNGVAVWTLNGASSVLDTLIDESELAMRADARSGMRVGANRLDPLGFDSYRVYDTWSTHYENNNIDEDNLMGADQGTNGFDDPADYVNDAGVVTRLTALGPDDAGERETSPPYDTRLRSLQVRLRAYELDSRQIREVTVRQSYVPQ